MYTADVVFQCVFLDAAVGTQVTHEGFVAQVCTVPVSLQVTLLNKPLPTHLTLVWLLTCKISL